MDFEQLNVQGEALRKLNFYKDLEGAKSLTRRDVAEEMNKRGITNKEKFPTPKNFDSWVKYIDDTTGISSRDSTVEGLRTANKAYEDRFMALNPLAESSEDYIKQYIRPIEYVMFADLSPQTIEQAKSMIPSLEETLSNLQSGNIDYRGQEVASKIINTIQDVCDNSRNIY